MFLGLLCFEFLPGPMLRLFSRDALVISVGSYGFRWIGLSFLPLVTSLIFPVFFQAVGYAWKSSLLTILRTVVLFVPLGWELSLLGLHAFWLTFPVTETVTSLVGFGFCRQFLRRGAPCPPEIHDPACRQGPRERSLPRSFVCAGPGYPKKDNAAPALPLAFPPVPCCNWCIHQNGRGGIAISLTSASLPAKKRILTVCVKLFLEKGYRRTTLAESIEKAGVSYSSFQNIFRAKDGVLTELVEFMFSNQFAMARSAASAQLPPVCVYAVETAIQMTLTELNENLREIYLEAYTQEEASEYIHRETAKVLYQIFGPYQPELTARDFYDMEIGSAGIMRGYMAHPCDGELTLERKLRLFLTMSLRAYHVPEEETEQAIRFVESLDIRAISERVMQELFRALAMRFEFSLAGIPLPAQT